jgi:hypothetical protein
MREIDHTHDTKDETDAERDERIDTAKTDGIRQKLYLTHDLLSSPK